MLAELLSQAHAEGARGWVVSVDSTIARAHQRTPARTGPSGGTIDLHCVVAWAG